MIEHGEHVVVVRVGRVGMCEVMMGHWAGLVVKGCERELVGVSVSGERLLEVVKVVGLRKIVMMRVALGVGGVGWDCSR